MARTTITASQLRTRGVAAASLVARRTREAASTATTRMAPLGRRAWPVLSVVSRAGWLVLAATVVTWIVGETLGWQEFLLIGFAGLMLLLLCALFTIGRARLQVDVELDPRRVVVGGSSAGAVRLTNLAKRPLLPLQLELPIGADAARFTLPALRPSGSHEELFVVPTRRRGVIDVGPARTVRGDPLGLFRRTVAWTEMIEMFVHPVTVPLEPLGAGLLRDLEGQVTNDLSTSDLAFHALREYQPGDDRRYIHWRSSARLNKFMVRQFLDTRRSHIVTVLDAAATSYVEPDDFEMAVSAAASVAVRALFDEQDLTVVAGKNSVPNGAGRVVLDAYSRVELTGETLVDSAARALELTADASVALLITGSLVPYETLRRAAATFPQEARAVALRIDPAAPTGVSGGDRLLVLSLRALSELPALLRGVLQ